MALRTEKPLSPTSATAHQATSLHQAAVTPSRLAIDTPVEKPTHGLETRDKCRSEYAPSRLAMTGGTGALGRRFLERIMRDLPDLCVTALVRKSSPSFTSPEVTQLIETYPDRLHFVDSDLRHGVLSPMERKAITDTDGGLWHFAASTNLRPGSVDGDQLVREVNEGGTARILEIMSVSDKPGPLFHLSTAYVCGDRSGLVREEELVGGHQFRNSYEASKHAAEERVRKYREDGGTCVIFRPSLVTNESAGDTAGHILDVLAGFFASAARTGRRLMLPMPSTAAINAVNVDWLVRALLALAPNSKASRTYHLTARKETCISTFASVFTRLFGAFGLQFAEANEVLSNGAARLAKILTPFRPYFNASARFDRSNLELDAPHIAGECELDLERALQQWKLSVR